MARLKAAQNAVLTFACEQLEEAALSNAGLAGVQLEEEKQTTV